ncbi:MAG: 6-carboxytetrahydropterin synthase QueD [Victivallaceae bacterium]
MYELEVTTAFSSAHQLNGYPGDCRKLHGHNWSVVAVLQAKELDEVGIAVDFKRLKRELDPIISHFDHAYLNDLPEFADMNPTSENIARVIYQLLKPKINDGNVKLSRISVLESPNSKASYFED